MKTINFWYNEATIQWCDLVESLKSTVAILVGEDIVKTINFWYNEATIQWCDLVESLKSTVAILVKSAFHLIDYSLQSFSWDTEIVERNKSTAFCFVIIFKVEVIRTYKILERFKRFTSQKRFTGQQPLYAKLREGLNIKSWLIVDALNEIADFLDDCMACFNIMFSNVD